MSAIRVHELCVYEDIKTGMLYMSNHSDKLVYSVIPLVLIVFQFPCLPDLMDYFIIHETVDGIPFRRIVAPNEEYHELCVGVFSI